MKGFYIYEVESRIGTVVDCLELGGIVQSFTHEFTPTTITEEVKMHALVSKGTKTKCSKDDTYDFETGALIALMKMCGVDKVIRACNEAFSEDTFKTYAIKYERELNALKKDFDKARELKDFYKKNYEDVKEHYDKLGDRNKYLIEDINTKLGYLKEKDEEIKRLNASICAKGILNNKLLEENKELKGNIDELFESEQHTKSELGRLYFEKHRLEEQVEKLQHEYDLCENSENALKITTQMQNKSIEKLTKAIDGYKNDLYKVSKRCTELEAKEAILNKQEETINKKEEDLSVYFGGRGNGKQYKALVEMFKKLDKKKVQEAYKEAYGERVIWCTSQPEVHPLSTAVLEGVSYLNKKFKTYSIDEWLYKIPTKREEMWDKIFELHKENDVIIEVKKEDITTFLHEIEDKIPEITWASDNKIFEAKGTIKDIYEELKTHNRIYFRLSKKNKLSYSSDLNAYLFINPDIISYLPPMRWDLFKKGRLAVKVNYDNYKEFYEACEKELGKRPLTNFACIFTVSICKDDGFFEIFTVENQKKTGRKIVNWEDVK